MAEIKTRQESSKELLALKQKQAQFEKQKGMKPGFKLLNPIGLDISDVNEESFKKFLGTLSPKDRIKYEELKQEASRYAGKVLNEDLNDFFIGLLHSSTMGGLKAANKGFEEDVNRAIQRDGMFSTGNFVGNFTPVPGAVLKIGTKAAKPVIKLLSKIPLPAAAKATIALGVEGMSSGAALEAMQIDKLKESLERNGGNIQATIIDRSKDIKDAAKLGFGFGAATGGLTYASSLPRNYREKALQQLQEELTKFDSRFDDVQFAFKKSSGGKANLPRDQIAKVLNVPKNQADEFFKTHGETIEDVVAKLGVKGSLEELAFQSKLTGKGNTKSDQLLAKRNQLLDKSTATLNGGDIDDIFGGVVQKIADAKQRDPELAKRMEEVYKSLKNRFSPGMNMKQVKAELDFINNQERRFTKSTAVQDYDRQGVYNEVGRNLRSNLMSKNGAEYINAQKQLDALRVINKTTSETAEAVKKGTMAPQGMADPIGMGLRKIVDKTASFFGVNPRDVSDFFGETAIKNKTLQKARQSIQAEEKLRANLPQAIKEKSMPGIMEKTSGVVDEALSGLGIKQKAAGAGAQTVLQDKEEPEMSEVDMILNEVEGLSKEEKITPEKTNKKTVAPVNAQPQEPAQGEVEIINNDVDSILDELGV
jgi:hypothetical protein